MSEFNTYIDAIDDIEDRITDDRKYPVVKDNKVKTCCKVSLEFLKIVINYLKYDIMNATKKESSQNEKKTPIPEDFE